MKADKIQEIIKKMPRTTAFMLEKTIREVVMHGPERTGRHYKGNPSRSSAPGEPPKQQSGFLVKDDNLYVQKVNDSTFKVYLTAPYAELLEFGTKSMEPRPFVKPSIEKVIEKINK